MCAFPGFLGQHFESRHRARDKFVFVQCARSKREKLPPDLVLPGLRNLAREAELRQRTHEVKCGAVVQPDLLAEVGECDALGVGRDLLENCERASERLNAATLLYLRPASVGGLAGLCGGWRI